jgi:hypothetical protein
MDEGLETTSTHSKDSANDDGVENNGIYGGKNDDGDGDFIYHSSDGLDKDDEDGNEVLGNSADGTSSTMSTCGKDGQSFIGGQLDNLPDWLHDIETNNTYDASLLLAAPIAQCFSVRHMQEYQQPHNMDSRFSAEDKQYHMGGV